MAQFIKVIHTFHYFAEALSWGAIAYSAFLIFGRGWLGILCGALALIATISVWSLFASSRAFFRSPIAVVASRVVLYALAVVGLVVAELQVEAIILAVLLVLTEGTLIGFKAHPALHPHSGGQARLVSNANPKSAERRAPSNRGPRIVPGVQATSGEQRTGQFMTRREARLAREAQAKSGEVKAGEPTAARIVGETPKRPRKKKH
ncbi:DUF2568 domain-containing protein [Brevibacterium sp. UMB1308A]|uniref:DUF2568 domain-containing protein n=1 Tax=Brevibacterium sp. UMB1308A TaxID=3050608 RepID=UPI00254D509D|nr:DUF2568 domain-containing protein [Brevibacterium sp. UMB1308A]MDK8346846.1 DUF2568 domain-containing protein [Brevibacterium sp. UMB1308B]MDK8713994.1 DUF2568 domain-containing protein [Brevibacterium sp. UMB1308A]